MRKNIILLLACFLFSATSLFAAEDVKVMSAESLKKDLVTEDVQVMRTEDLKKDLAAEDISILDVRSERGWTKSDVKIPGALRVTWDNFKEWAESVPEENKKESRFVLYCS